MFSAFLRLSREPGVTVSRLAQAEEPCDAGERQLQEAFGGQARFGESHLISINACYLNWTFNNPLYAAKPLEAKHGARLVLEGERQRRFVL